MNRPTTAPSGPRDNAAECHSRASADRARAQSMDTANGRRKFEQSAASWDLRGALLARLEASFVKRRQLDAESARYSGASVDEDLQPARPISWEGRSIAARPPKPVTI